MLLTSFLFSATLKKMDNIDQQVSPQPKVSNIKMRLLIFATLLFFVVISGMGGYVFGKKANHNNQPVPIPTPTIVLFRIRPTTSATIMISSPTSPLVTQPSLFPSPTLPELSISTANWKRYSNQAGLFSFMYPDSYSLHENELRAFEGGFEPAPNTVELEAVNTIPQPAYLPYDIRIVFEKVQGGTSLNEYVDKKSTCLQITAKEGKQYMIAGSSSGMIFENTGCGAAGSTVIYLMHADMVYKVVVSDYVDANERKFLDQFLLTFQFTK